MLLRKSFIIVLHFNFFATAKSTEKIIGEWSSEISVKQSYEVPRKKSSRNEESLTGSFFSSPNNDNSNHAEAAKMKDPLESFVACLKSFIFDTNFSVDSFESAAENLEVRLLEISHTIYKLSPTPELLNQLEFAGSMFNTMVDSIEMLKHFDLMGSVELYLVHCMIDLNVQLLALYDSHGLPASHTPGYSYKVSRFSDMIQQWKHEFQHLKLVRYGIRSMFRKQYSQADMSILYLKSFLGKNSK